jgi:hypothetical protein
MYIKSNKSSKANHTFKKFFYISFVYSVFTPNYKCTRVAPLTSEGNATQAAAVNDGIVYLM